MSARNCIDRGAIPVLLLRETERAPDQAQPHQSAGLVVPIVARRSRRPRQEADPHVVADGLDVGARRLRQRTLWIALAVNAISGAPELQY